MKKVVIWLAVLTLMTGLYLNASAATKELTYLNNYDLNRVIEFFFDCTLDAELDVQNLYYIELYKTKTGFEGVEIPSTRVQQRKFVTYFLEKIEEIIAFSSIYDYDSDNFYPKGYGFTLYDDNDKVINECILKIEFGKFSYKFL